MPINTDLNTAPYFDDFDIENQFYRVLFKPGYAVQARELTQLQTILQNQIEQFGDNIFKEGSIVKGCNFTTLNNLKYVKLEDRAASETVTFFDPEAFISKRTTEVIGGIETEVDIVYVAVGLASGLSAEIISASRGFETRPPNLNTFYINYLNSASTEKQFRAGETIRIDRYKYKVGALAPGETNPFSTEQGVDQINATTKDPNPVGDSFGIQAAPGIIFQKGHFLFCDSQIIVIEKYSNVPSDAAVGYRVQESLTTNLQDSSLYDNANGSTNQNAPGADRLKLTPILVKLTIADADRDATFFSLIRYSNGNAVRIRDISSYNVLGDVTARRTYEESGNYVLEDFDINADRKDGQLKALVGSGVAYVKGYRVENVGEEAFQITDVSNTEIVTSQPASFDYGTYVDVTGFSGYINISMDTEQDLLDSSDVKVGECFVSNLTPTRAYIWGISLNAGKDFSDVAKIDAATTGEITVGNVLKESSKNPFVFDTGMNYLYEAVDIVLPIRGQTNATVNSNEFTLVAGPGEDFALNQNSILVVTTTGTQVNVVNTSTALNNSQLTVELQNGVVSNGQSVVVYYDYRLVDATPNSKLSKEPYLKIDHVTSRTRFTLGFPDVYSIISITDSTGKDYTNSFRLNSNQKDRFYDLSFIEYIQGRPRPGNEQLTLQIKVFQPVQQPGEDSFFCINSYPNTLGANDIPIYKSESGVSYNLRDCLDFRPHVDIIGGMNYNQSSASGAPIINAAALSAADSAQPTFSNTYTIPAAQQFAQADLEYYLSRIDAIVVDSYGTFSIIRGEEERNPRPPAVSPDQLVVSEITIPGFPVLSPREATQAGQLEYSVRATPRATKAYRMEDIARIEKKIDSLTYYTSLNQLEQETQNLQILDENGLTRFKNGFIVDPFNNLSIAKVRDPKFNAAIAFNQKILTPSVRTFELDLKYKSATNASIFPPTASPNVVSLSRNAHISIINQPYATEFRNCVSNFYNYRGIGNLSPNFDAVYDTVTNPVVIDFSQEIGDLVENLQQFIPLTDARIGTNENQLQDAVRRARERGGTVTFTDIIADFNLTEGTTRPVGDFVTNFQFRPFIAARDISIYVAGLRPNTLHYFFFDKVDVNDDVCPGTIVDDANDVQRNGIFSDSVSSDANGVLRAVFRIPPETFFVGERVLEIADVDQYDSIDSGATSTAILTYRAYNFSVEKAALSTRMPDSEIVTSTSNRSVTFRRPPDGGGDPLAQTFFVKKGMGRGSNTVFASKIDLYFKRKSTVNGVTVMLREVVNGYPSGVTIPFSKVHLIPSQVNVSDDASAVTTVDFKAPILLETEKEYAFVVMPDANDPNYLIFTSKVGGTNLVPGNTQGQAVVQDWGDGVLFTSTNNSAWKSVQDEDVKFNLYRHDFNASTGVAKLTNADHEFFTVDDITGQFRRGEIVYQEKGSPQTIGMTGTTITGTGFDAVYAVGDYIFVSDGGSANSEIYQAVDVTPTEITTNKPSPYNITGGQATSIVAGELCYYNPIEPEVMYIKDSSARSTKIFQSGSDIIGFDTRATANIVSIDNINLSYVQPFISRVNDVVSKTTIEGEFIPPANIGTTYRTAMKFNDNNYFNKEGVVLYSKTNNLAGSLLFEIDVNMSNGSNSTSSPLIDIETSKLLAYKYNITNTTDESANYISKVVELAEDFDAEDFNLIVTGYKPIGAEIKTYIKAQNVFDSESFDALDWVELELFEGVEVFSSTTNLNDYREFRYRIADANKDGSGVYQYTSKSGTFKTYRKFAIRIELLSPNVHSVPKLMDYRGIALT